MGNNFVPGFLNRWFGSKNYGFVRPRSGQDIYCHLDTFQAVQPSPDFSQLEFGSVHNIRGQWPRENDAVYCEVTQGPKGTKATWWCLQKAYDRAKRAVQLGPEYRILESETGTLIYICHQADLGQSTRIRDIQLRCLGKTIQWQISKDFWKEPDSYLAPSQTWEDCSPPINLI